MTISKNDQRPGPFYANYDYGGPENESEEGPGLGIYNGNMDKYDSIKEFLSKKRKSKKKKKSKVRKQAYNKYLGI